MEQFRLGVFEAALSVLGLGPEVRHLAGVKDFSRAKPSDDFNLCPSPFTCWLSDYYKHFSRKNDEEAPRMPVVKGFNVREDFSAPSPGSAQPTPPDL
jgi:hypothetical protein